MGQARIVALVRQFEKLQSLVPAVEVPTGRRDIDGRSILMLVERKCRSSGGCECNLRSRRQRLNSTTEER